MALRADLPDHIDKVAILIEISLTLIEFGQATVCIRVLTFLETSDMQIHLTTE